MRPENFQSLAGLALIIGFCWALSENRRAFPWKLALGVLALQAGLIVLLFAVPATRDILRTGAAAVDGLASSTQAGVGFVFGFLAGGDAQPYQVANPGGLYVFAFRVLPVILVVCALSALLWHWRILKWLIAGFGFVFRRLMGVRGAPALATAATMFMGQVEGPIFIRGYLPNLTRSELFMLITVGMTCVAGSTLVAYSTILHGILPNIGAHVLAASFISAPAGILLARILVPRDAAAEGDDSADLSNLKLYDSSIDAVMKGTQDGLTIALNVGATLIVFVALIAMANGLLSLLPPIGGEPIKVERILGAVFAPLAWAIGVPWREASAAGSMLGLKLVLTEFAGFTSLAHAPAGLIGDRTRLLMTYAMCGFGNIASAGINVAGYSVLVPERRGEVLGLVWKAMMAGFLATCFTAAVVGALPAAVYPR
jgi:concentrative nucleoside transporter, CNT family